MRIHTHAIWRMVLAVVVWTTAALCWHSLPAAAAPAPADKFAAVVRFVDFNNQPLPGIALKAWLANNQVCQGEAVTRPDGTAMFSFTTPGRYYFTADLTDLKKRNDFADKLYDWDNFALGYISMPVTINEKSGIVPLALSRDGYVDLIDIADDGPLDLHILQLELGIRYRVTSNYHLLRMYAPPRYRYSVKNNNDTLGMLWVYYAAPRIRMVISIL